MAAAVSLPVHSLAASAVALHHWNSPVITTAVPGLGDNADAGVARDRAGNLVIAYTSHDSIVVQAGVSGRFYGVAMTAGRSYTVAGNGTPGLVNGPALSAELDSPSDLVVDAAGNVVFVDSLNSELRVLAEAKGTFYGVAMQVGRIYTIAGNGTAGFADGPALGGAEFKYPWGLALDRRGNILIGDNDQARVRMLDVDRGTYFGTAMTPGRVYTVAGDGYPGFTSDRVPATSAGLYAPGMVGVDADGNILICDKLDQRIRVVAAGTGTYYGQAMKEGEIYTIAGDGTAGFNGDGGPATSAEVNWPEGVTVDGAGNVLIADSDNDRIRVIPVATGVYYSRAMTAGHIYTIAGDGRTTDSGDGGPARAAGIGWSYGVIVIPTGQVLFSDAQFDSVREITPPHLRWS